MISIRVADNQLWLLWLNEGYHYEPIGRYGLYGPYLYDYHLNYRTSVCDYWLTAISVNVWPYQGMSDNQSMYYKQSYFFSLFYYLNIFLLYGILIVIYIIVWGYLYLRKISFSWYFLQIWNITHETCDFQPITFLDCSRTFSCIFIWKLCV